MTRTSHSIEEPRPHDLPRVKPLAAPLGAEIHGVDLSAPLAERAFAVVEDALHRYEVVVFRGQSLTDAALKQVSLAFGPELNIHPLHQFNKPDVPEITVLSNIIGADGKALGATDAGQHWHSDLSYTTHPSRVTLLYALEVPLSDAGEPLGETRFASTSRAYEDLPASMKLRLRGLRASHFAQKPKGTASHFNQPLSAEVEARLQKVVHPVVRTHPYTGKQCLYVSRGFTVAIEGMPRDESDELLEFLYEHMTQDKYIYTHRWAVGNLVINDNCATIHKGTGNYKYPQRRLVYRTIVKGTIPY
jgi:taurine dioxygenase